MEALQQIPKAQGPTAPVLKWNDALAAATALGDKYVITSPNMKFIPEPPTGQVVVRVKTDGKFGKEDPLNWPQLFADDPRVDYLSCIPRPTCPTRQAATWTPFNDDDCVEYETGNELKMFTLRTERLGIVDDAIDWLGDQLMEYECDHGDTPELRQLVVCARLARDRLSHPGTQRDLLRQLVCVERHYCMALAWITWHICTEDLSLGKGVASVDENLMGCITTSPDMAGKLAQAGIPVWFMRQGYELVGSCSVVVNIVGLTAPANFSTTDRTASSNVYEGLPGPKQLLAIYRKGHICADVEAIPLPQDYCVEPSRGSTSDIHETRTEGGPSRHSKSAPPRAKPYPSPKVEPGRLSKFLPADHEGVPDMMQWWKTALQNTSPPNNKSKPTWGYFVPEASMLMAPSKRETRALYVINWLKIRVVWLLILADNEKRMLTPSTNWREYLAFGSNPRKEKHASVLRTMKEVWNINRKDVARRASTWCGRELTAEEVDVRTCREVTWEVCQIGFRYELWALDSIIVRREGPHALEIAAERIGWINEVCGETWLTRADDGLIGARNLAANTMEARLSPLTALCRLMRAWPNAPPETAGPLQLVDGDIDVTRLEQLEKVVATFYVLTFVRHAGRPPTIPRKDP